jgi:ricin-type beta-trefoil lectin protein
MSQDLAQPLVGIRWFASPFEFSGGAMRISNVWGTVTARHSGKIMDIAGVSPHSGALLQQWQFIPNQPNQRLRFERLSNGFYLIRVRHTNKVLDVAGGSRDSGAAVLQWDWHGGDNQQFAVEDAGDGFFRLRAKHSGKVLDVAGGSRDNGAHVIQWDQTGGANQLWRHGVPID